MRAAHVKAIGALPEPVELSEPSAADGQALIAVTSAALNPVELRVASGRMPGGRTPYVPGLEGVGTVVRSSTIPEGTRVRFENDLPGFGKDGAVREIAVAEEATLVELPSSIDDSIAAAAGVVGVTAELALRLAGMQGGERVAVLGATGGVGQMATQLAAIRGAASLVAVGRHRPTLDWLQSHGATASFALTESTDLANNLIEAAGGPLDIVVDPLWGAPAMGAILALADGGRIVNVGNTAGTDVELPLQALRKTRSAVMGLSSGWMPMPEKLDAYRFVIGKLAAGTLELNVERVPLASIGSAWSRQEQFPHSKIVISLV
ncbi:MAG TPA: zinc-binding alcohol dehydrogenase family protein [Acidimicrobiia bacterium]|nr:zinc-binding alcohol dehydrogenase family protein [Acidimicrobiia bacterium]